MAAYAARAASHAQAIELRSWLVTGKAAVLPS